MPLDLSKRVLVKPCNVFFYYSAEGTYNTCKVLIVNKSTRILRFKVLSTARSKYLLSTCKGVLKSGEFVEIDISISRISVNDDSKDFFKIQFFDLYDGSAFCEHYICSTISRNLSHNVAVQDSDSCSTWPSRYHDVGLSASNLRTASLSRAFESLTESEKRPITPQTHLSLDRTKCSNLPDVFSTVKAQKNKSNSGTLTIYRGVGGNHSESRRTSIIFSPNMLYNSLFVLSLFVCLLGILLPFFPYDCKLWLLSKVLHERQKIDYITTTASSLTFLREAQKVYGYSHPDKQNSRTTHSSANECPTVDNPSKDEFNRQTRLAFFAFKSAFRSICRAITALDPLVAVANVSWFCLGEYMFIYQHVHLHLF
ncbi:hypothetical protein EWB00_003404 [Schistosoma japonicum]|uniref:MSP domain-containing protein n=1 Tax=Schistosoma japonicum TaxID=6182 RepID=A0A4Z2DVX4_SCHJA|nr:hypothetical protein KSF78_0001126 [Schistosoma japonicum]TNN20665.1 hypothetical protein EWB00_003404 [Schistosoma japonicum]